ncbi:MAG: hypothetical protein HYV97_14255 [Bdellovibrio sp.]|nr:hypothetical protein [Bdellovibrio sp.]
MLALGLAGRNISHSKSQIVYEKLLGRKINYYLFDYQTDTEIPNLPDIFKVVSGLSITSPYKRHFLPQISAILDVPIKDSINCIKYESGKFYGTNTDYLAIREIIPRLIKEYNPAKVIVLGSGPMAYITKEILSTITKIPFALISRKTSNTFYSYDYSQDATINFQILIINACSRDFIFNNPINEHCIFWDFNYAHIHHQAKLAKNVGKYIDGSEMLELQASFAVKFWNIG